MQIKEYIEKVFKDIKHIDKFHNADIKGFMMVKV